MSASAPGHVAPRGSDAESTKPISGRHTLSLVWLSYGGCEGCTLSVLGATEPTLEDLLSGALTEAPHIRLVHPLLAEKAGHSYLRDLEQAASGESRPFILVVEGSVLDEGKAGDGFFSALGHRDGRTIPVSTWIEELAEAAALVVAIGTCATWGGIPAAQGSPTGAMGLTDYLGPHFQSRTGLPVINVPGCAPSGEAFLETISQAILHMEGILPLELDEVGRPRWLYSEPTPVASVRLPYPKRRDQPNEDEVAVECPVPRRGWINGVGGCATVGGSCNGCTSHLFPDGTLAVSLRDVSS